MFNKPHLTLILAFFVLAFGNIAFADKSQIVEDVLAEKGFYHADEIEKRLRFEALDSPLPVIEGELIEEGGCLSTNCLPETIRQHNYNSVPVLNAVTGINNHGNYVTDVRIKFSGAHIPLSELSDITEFQIVIIEDINDFCFGINCHPYKIYSIEPEFKPNETIKNKQFVSISDLNPGNYRVAMRATYSNGSIISEWSNQISVPVLAMQVSLAGMSNSALKSCLMNNGYSSATQVSDIEKIECSNQGLTDFDVSQITQYFSGVRYINISNNPNITGISGLGKLPHLKILDISENPNFNTANLGNFGDLDALIMRNMGQSNMLMPVPPHNATYIDYSGNHFTTWQPVYEDRRDNAIESLNLSNTNFVTAHASTLLTPPASGDVYINAINLSNNPFDDVASIASIKNLKHINVNNANLADRQVLTGISGLCSLSMADTGILSVAPVMPVQYLNLKNNTELRLAKPLQSAEYRPHWTDLSGSNALKCHKYYSYLDKSQPGSGVIPLTDFSILDPGNFTEPLPQCETQTTSTQYNPADFCKPAPVLEANVYEDINTSKRVIHWTPNPNHDYVRWGVTHYLITAYKNGNIVNEFTSPFPSTTLVTNSLDPDKYTVSICTEFQCGYNKEVTEFKQGLTKVFDSSGFWDLTDTNNLSFQLKFKYPQQVFDQSFGKPDYFEISPGFNQPGHNDPIIISVTNRNGNCIEGDVLKPCDGDDTLWFSEAIPENQFIGKDFVIKACRVDIGCGQRVSVRLPNPLVSKNLPVPGLDPEPEDVFVLTEITLSWDGQAINNWNSTHDDSEAIHYIEVTEEQPVRRAHSPFDQTPGKKTIVYYHEVGGSNTINLTRLVKGTYRFKLKACTRNRETGDVCSKFSPEKSIELHRSNITQGKFNRAQPSASKIFKALHIEDSVEAIIFEESNSKPDYYSIKISSKPGTDDLGVFCGDASWTHGIIQSNNNNRVMQITSPNSKYISTYNLCRNPIDAGLITISSCFDGVGCNQNYWSVHVDYENLNQIGDVQFINNENNNNLNSNPIGGPGDMRPGAWWNPLINGTGWHFHWANELRYPSMHDQYYGETYDLLGIWMTYQLIDGDWSPVWMRAHLKKEDDPSNPATCENFDCSRYFEGDLTYVTRDSNGITHHKVGHIQVFFDSENPNIPDGNRDVLLKMDIDTNDGLLTLPDVQFPDNENCEYNNNLPTGTSDRNCPWLSADGSLYMPLSNYDNTAYGNPNIGGTENDINHYSGMWSPTNSDGTVDTIFTYMVDIIRNYEWATLLFYDDNGLPIWGVSDSCCTKTTEQKLDLTYYSLQRGFDPLNFTPEDWSVSQHAFEIGSDLANNRTFSDPDTREYREMKLQVNINGNGQWPGGRQASVSTNGIKRNLEKQASFHDIRFFVNGQDENVTECDPNTAANGECIIKFTWFTDDDFIDIKPFYRKDNGVLADLTQLCGLPLQDSYVVTDYTCTIYQPGNYKFELAKPSEESVGEWVTIAESKELSILPCNSEFCEVNTYTPLEPVTESSEPYIGPDSSGNGNNDGILEWSDLPDPPKQSEEVGATEGTLTITPMGAVSYIIPIMTAPASGGLQPNLSINYNSQAGRGSMGLGWSIGGYSVISRCAQTFEQDYDENSTEPLIQSVTFTESDRFCVDGQRLMLVDGTGEYGSDGAEYRTEIDTITKYFSIGTQGSGPQCFEAWHKDGSKTLYGDCNSQSAADDSAFAVSGIANGAAMMWAQSRFVDDKGNYYTHHYHSNIIASDTVNNTVEFYLDEVKYTANENVSGSELNGSIKLVYQNTPLTSVTGDVVVTNYTDHLDPASDWRNVSVKILKNNKKLIRIDSKYNNEYIKSYKFDYEDVDTAGIAVLTKVQECASSIVGSSCLNPTTFDWGNSAENTIGTTSSNPLLNLGNINDNEYAVTSLDANGDGHDDFYVTGGIDTVFLNNPDTNSFSAIATLPLSNDFSIADINADGFPDFADKESIYLWNGDGYDAPISISTYGYDIKKFIDMNGDGLVDAIGVRDEYDPVRDVNVIYVGIFTNRYDLTHDDPGGMGAAIAAAFSEPEEISIDFNSNNFISDYKSDFVSGTFYDDLNLLPPDLEEVVSVYDANNDGIPEILVEFEKDNWCQDQGQDCNDPGVITMYTSVYAELHYQQDDMNGLTYVPEYVGGSPGCEACEVKITTPTVLDINGDGKLEKCYVEKHPYSSGYNEDNGFLKCQGKSIGGLNHFFEEIRQNNFVDLNGDGFLDLLYSNGNGANAKWQVNYTDWDNGQLSYSNNWLSTNFKSGNAEVDVNNPNQQAYLDKNLFIDINNDNIIDHLLFQVNRTTNELELFSSLGQNSQGEIHEKDKIVTFTNGLGESWDVEFGSMADTDVYERETNSYIMWFGQSRSPVFDYVSSMPLVAAVEHSMPAWDISGIDLSGSAISHPNWQSRTEYHYKNAKLQAGGRGFLGFGEFSVFDNDTRTLTQSKKRQDFPFIGATYETYSWYVPTTTGRNEVNSVVKDLSKPCWVDNSCGEPTPTPNPCLTNQGFYCPAGTLPASVSRNVDTSGATLLNSTEVIWNSVSTTDTQNRSRFVFQDKVYNDTYELNGGAQMGSVITANKYIPAFGFLKEKIVTTYQGVNTENNWAQKQTTILQLEPGFDTNQWIVDRVKLEKVTNERPDVANEIRRIDRTFDANALLKTESYKGTSPETRIRTIVTRNSFGQIAEETMSADDAITTAKKNSFDTDSRLLVKTQNKLNGTFVTNEQILQFNSLGLPEITKNAQGLKTFIKYDAMGKLFYTIDETGAFSQVTYHNGKGTYCPNGTVYYTLKSSQVNGDSIVPAEWTCYDKLNRTIRTVTQGFKASQKIYIDQQYDTSGRLIATSSPLYQIPSIANTNHWTRYGYDELGREIIKREPFSPTSPDGSQENITTTFYKYDGSRNLHKMKVTNANNHLTRTFTDILGQVKLMVDGENTHTEYDYDARGNKTLVDGPLVGDEIYTTYDEFDNVKTINDPDLGFWHYKYNAIGQLLHQRDTEANCTRMVYDELGRVTDKYYYTDSTTNCELGNLEDHHSFVFDNTTGDSSFGQLISESSNASQKSYNYDVFGRIDTVTSSLIDYSLIRSEQTFYDAYGRTLAYYDASEEGSLYHYNSQGYQQSIQGIRTGIIYQTIQDQNAFGHVTREVTGNDIHTYREYDVSGRMKLLMTGHGNGGSDIQYMTYQYDAVGNMTVRNDSRVIGNELIEAFTYDRVNRLERVDTTFTDPIFGLIEFTDYDITYDAGGRRSTLKHGYAPTITYNYDPNHIHGVAGTTDGKSYGYDNVGNQTLSDGRVLEYTAFNKAKRMSKGSYAVEYSYGANNEKLTRKDIYTGDETLTWYVGNVEIVTTGWSGGVPGSIKYKRYLGDSTLVTHHGPEIIDIDYMFKDHLGSTQVIASHAPSGYGLRHLSYDAFGKNRPITRPDPILNYFLISNITNRGFTGQDHVSELNLINFKARMYDPNLGMMLQADTVVPDGPVVDSLNRYAYVFNNPLSYADPTGNTPRSVIDPWYHMRQENNRMLPPNTTRDTNGLMGGTGVSQRALPQERDNTTTQHDMPAGVGQGSMQNGDTHSKNKNNVKNSDSEFSNETEFKKNNKDGIEQKSIRSILDPIYDNGRGWYHEYQNEAAICLIYMNSCNIELAFNALRHYPYPGYGSERGPIQDGDINYIDTFNTGSIITRVEENTHSIFNITLADHTFRNGYVHRQVFEREGTLFLRTYGEGNNTNFWTWSLNYLLWRPGFNQDNQKFRTHMVQEYLRRQE